LYLGFASEVVSRSHDGDAAERIRIEEILVTSHDHLRAPVYARLKELVVLRITRRANRLQYIDDFHERSDAFEERITSFQTSCAFVTALSTACCKLPIVQMTRKADRLPFDFNQIRTVVIDTSDIYSLVPRLETFRSEIATQVRKALSEGDATMTPLSVFLPGFSVTLPKEK